MFTPRPRPAGTVCARTTPAFQQRGLANPRTPPRFSLLWVGEDSPRPRESQRHWGSESIDFVLCNEETEPQIEGSTRWGKK